MMADKIYFHQQFSVIHALIKQMDNMQREITFRLEEMELMMEDTIPPMPESWIAGPRCNCDKCNCAPDYRMD